LTNRDGNLILIRGHGSLLTAEGMEKAGPRVPECLPLVEKRGERMAWDLVIDAAGSTGRLHDTQDIRQEFLRERE